MKRVASIFLLFSLLAAESRAGELDDARQLAVQGRHADARETARRVLLSRPNDPEALQIIVAASCELGDRQGARRALARLAPDVQAAAARHCARCGIAFDQEPSRLEALEATAAPDPRRPWRIGSWITLATGAASLLTVVALVIHVKQLEQEKEELIRAQREKTPGNYTLYSGPNACSEARDLGDHAMIDVCRSGSRSQVAANILLGVGLATAALGGYLYYRGYLKEEHPTTRLSIGPGGAALRVSF